MNAQAESLAQLGDFIAVNIDNLVAAWEQECRRQNLFDEAHEPVHQLRDHLPQFLRAMAENLRSAKPVMPCEFAVQHGIQRWQLGWHIDSLVRDFMMLRRVLAERLRANYPECTDEILEVIVTLDEAVAASVSEYVRQQEKAALERTKDLEEKNERLRQLAYLIAHELRNPLALIEMAADRRDDSMTYLREGAVTARQIVNDLLVFAKADAASLDQDDVDLNEALKDAILALRHIDEEVEQRVVADRLPIVRGNHQLIAKVFENLIENAIKYAGDKPPSVRVSVAARETEWVIAVQDRGVGIPRDQHERIFEFLNRAHPDLEVEGTGIGLALCERVIEAHGGRIWVESKVGDGSTFYFTLPQRAAGKKAGTGEPGLNPQHSPRLG